MDFELVRPFILKCSESKNPVVKLAADGLEPLEGSQPFLEKQQNPGTPLGSKPKDQLDDKLHSLMPDMVQQDSVESGFGKAASSYSCDVSIDSLPKDTQKDIKCFSLEAQDDSMVVQYGMVVDELLHKVDPHNYKLAEEHLCSDLKKKGKKAIGDLFQEKSRNKYILIVNDRVVDGHHFIALARCAGVTCSLRVLDLTPLRFQIVKKATLLESLALSIK